MKRSSPVAMHGTAPTHSFSPHPLDPTVTSAASTLPPILLAAVPEVHPLPWIIINHAAAVSGCLLFADVVYASWEERAERPFARGFYLLWEFLICFFWLVETGLSVGYQRLHLRRKLEWYAYVELIIAAYFVADTFQLFQRWDLQEYDTGVLLDIAVDTGFYLYLAARSWGRSAASGGGAGDGETLLGREEEG